MPTIAIAGHHLHHLDRGTGPALLLGHSYLWDHRMWAPQIDRWATRHRVIATDLWAHGASDPPPPDTDLDALADHHAALLRALGVGTCVVVGLSLGGMWAPRLALRHPELVAGLVLLDTSVAAEPQASAAPYAGKLDQVAAAGCLPAGLRAQIVPPFFAAATRRDRPELVAAFDADLAAIPPERIPGLVAMGRATFGRADLLPRFATLQVPTLIGVGSEDPYRPPAESRAMAAVLPDAELVEWPDAAHVANLDRPAAVSTDIERFLARIGWGAAAVA